MDVYATAIALLIAILAGGFAARSDRDDPQKTPQYGNAVGVSVVVFVVVYLIYTMSTDSNDNAGMLDNIKTGEPPF